MDAKGTQRDKSDRSEPGRDAGLFAHWMEPVVGALDHAAASEIQRDPFRRDPRTVREWLPYFQAQARYFGSEIRGWENLPAEGPFLVVANHSGGAQTSDSAAFLARWIEERGAEAPIYSLAYDLLFAYPVVGRLLPRLGVVPANPENARRALAMGAPVLVFPGGDEEVFRPWSERNKIRFGAHRGFLALALESGVPVVPLTIHGAHESTFVLTRGRRIARAMSLGRLRVNVFPWIWNVPFGPAPAFVPSLPLPAKVTVQIGEPLDWSGYGPEKARDPEILQRCYDEVTDVMQRTLDALAREHPYPVLTRFNELRPIHVLRRLLARERG